MAEGNLSCKQFTDILIRRTEHLDEEIIRDITPTDGWIGHVSTGVWNPYDGVSKTFDRINRVWPDLSGCWQDVQVGSCVGTPCDPTEKKIGFGYTRDSYHLQERSYSTDLFCFDLIMSADKAKEQFRGLVENLKEATNHIVSERFRTEALRIAGKKIIAGAGLTPLTYTLNDDCTRITPNALPTSKITIQMLMRQIEPLKLNGYFGKVPGMPMLAEYVTDELTGFTLVQGNASLTNQFRFEDFMKGGVLYKYGMVNGIGNFGFRYDTFPMRFQVLADGITLERVYPYMNTTATDGIKGDVNDAYVNAPYQIDFIWHRLAMKTMVAKMAPLNPEMPFMVRDLAGKWYFAMDNLGADANGCVIENKRRNKGMFFSDFRNATKAERPEWVVAILHHREIACVVDVPSCNPVPDYVVQDYSSANAPCPNPDLTFDLSGLTAPYSVAADSITCNGVPVDHPAITDEATLTDLAAQLNTDVPQLGTWSADEDAGTIILAGSTCNTVELPATGA